MRFLWPALLIFGGILWISDLITVISGGELGRATIGLAVGFTGFIILVHGIDALVKAWVKR